MRSKLDMETGLRNKGSTQENSHHRYFIYGSQDAPTLPVRSERPHKLTERNTMAPRVFHYPAIGSLLDICYHLR